MRHRVIFLDIGEEFGILGNIPDAAIGEVVLTTLSGFGGRSPLSLEMSGGSLPSGWTALNNGDGTNTISGTAVLGDSGDYTAEFTLTDGEGVSITRSFEWSVAVLPLTLLLVLPDATEETAYVGGSATGEGGIGAKTYAKVAGPAWLGIHATTGAITGTPQVGDAATGVTVTVRVTDSTGATATATDMLDVSALMLSTHYSWVGSGSGDHIATGTGVDLSGGGIVVVIGMTGGVRKMYYGDGSGTVEWWHIGNSTSAGAAGAFGSDGFTVPENSAGVRYIAFVLRAFPGFLSVDFYTGTGSPQAIAHRLAATPSAAIVAPRAAASHRAVFNAARGTGAEVSLNTTGWGDSSASGSAGDWWNGAPTGSVFHVHSHAETNAAATSYAIVTMANSAEFGLHAGSYGGSDSDKVLTPGFVPDLFVCKILSGNNGTWIWTDRYEMNGGDFEGSDIALEATTSKNPGTLGAGDAFKDNGTGIVLTGSNHYFVNNSSRVYIYFAVRWSGQ